MSKVSCEMGLMKVFLVLNPPQFEMVIFIVLFCANGKMKCFINTVYFIKFLLCVVETDGVLRGETYCGRKYKLLKCEAF